MSFSDSVFYYWSDKEWDSCDKFRTAATGVLNPKGYPNMLEWSGSDTTVRTAGKQEAVAGMRQVYVLQICEWAMHMPDEAM